MVILGQDLDQVWSKFRQFFDLVCTFQHQFGQFCTCLNLARVKDFGAALLTLTSEFLIVIKNAIVFVCQMPFNYNLN